ncbi:uncharacterized protein LOC101848327 [Aplysia californica]|uniref:Uncharacterized protein LOC101848327 n=1 Tax=Aplysia californica TaxID=6500 RepID=A0ABM0JAR2_APLCA|nr:uncharacterized protein LOC101848327 [Aplysia californica]XP_035824663.1 uncharacterized protein LOC101848327 [Aplysia californica]
MRRVCRLPYDVTEFVLMILMAGVTWSSARGTDMTLPDDFTYDMSTSDFVTSSFPPPMQADQAPEACCKGVLGYASDNESANFPCQGRPCCNSSETVAVVSIDHALGFRFQCMATSGIQPLCYEAGAEVRTSNHDPDFIPRACCPGSEFKVLINQWFAATVVKCVKKEKEKS